MQVLALVGTSRVWNSVVVCGILTRIQKFHDWDPNPVLLQKKKFKVGDLQPLGRVLAFQMTEVYKYRSIYCKLLSLKEIWYSVVTVVGLRHFDVDPNPGIP